MTGYGVTMQEKEICKGTMRCCCADQSTTSTFCSSSFLSSDLQRTSLGLFLEMKAFNIAIDHVNQNKGPKVCERWFGIEEEQEQEIHHLLESSRHG
jgi:hypothetical protein